MADKGFTPEQQKKDLRNELARLKRENQRLKLKVERQDAMLDLQKKNMCHSCSHGGGISAEFGALRKDCPKSRRTRWPIFLTSASAS